MSPKELLELNDRKELNLPPPQKYELSRLEKITDVEAVIRFAKDRNKLGTTLVYPFFYRTNDGQIGIYPGWNGFEQYFFKCNLMKRIVFNCLIIGDDLYPSQPDFEGVNHDSDVYKGKSREELRNMCKNIHRFEGGPKGFPTKLFCNIELPNGHINPVYDVALPIKHKM